MTDTDRMNEDTTGADAIYEVLRALAHGGFTVDDEQLKSKIYPLLPEPSATDPRPVRAKPAVVHSVAVQGIRSFGPEQILRLSEGLTIVYAGNGKGKTSLSDAFELVADGVTTRSRGLPLATSEVKDKDHITHRTLDGTPDPEHPPRVTVRYRRGEELHECAWTDFNSPAPRRPDLQVLPRRLLRELVNAKRTERIEPLGAALGLPETSASWTAIAKALGEMSKEASEGGEPHLKLLEREVSLEGDDTARVAALARWASVQKIQLENLPVSPSADPWRQLAGDLEAATDPDAADAPLSAHLTALLTEFVEVAEPGADCPACAQASVPQSRLDEVRAMLAASEEAARRAEQRATLAHRLDALSAQVGGWLDATDPPDGAVGPEHEDWRQSLFALRNAFAQREQLGDAPWMRGVADALDSLDKARACVAHSAVDDAALDRRRAVDAITADADGTRKALEDLEVRRVTLAPMLKRAQAMTKAMLVERVQTEFLDLEGPINDWLSILGPVGTPRISLSAKATSGRPSLDLLVAGLPGSASAPHATGYLSDAQLDMLGMSAHLARIERDHPGSTIVIDDPSDMLDSTSRRALASKGISRLLDGEGSSAHQVLVLTHDDQLVRDLWDGHRHRNPATVQDTMEIHRCDDGTDTYTVLTSRGTTQAVARAVELKKGYWDQHQDRMWFRAAFAAHTRQAIEMCAKDMDTLLGQAGIELHPEGHVPDESKDLGKVRDKVLSTLRRTTERWCSHGRHTKARRVTAEIADLLSQSSTQFLNPGAHADVILPDASSTAALLDKVDALAKQFAAPEDQARSSWTTQSPIAKALRISRDCPDCPVAVS